MFKNKVGRPSKYKHTRALTGAERIKALRAKQILASAPITSLQYKKALAQLEELYSEGVNPNQAQTELRDRYGQRVDIHGFGWKDTDEYKEEQKQDRYWGVSQANKKRRSYHSHRASSSQERVERYRSRNR